MQSAAVGLLLDTDVLIDYLRGRPEAVSFLQNATARLTVSAATVAELYVGVREGQEREVLDRFIAVLDPVAMTPEMAVQAGLWRRQYGGSHGTGLLDATIAATAHAAGCTLVTLNAKHFPMLTDLHVPYRKS